MGKEILINQLFAGRYLDMGENVGHEIINLFEADNGANYFYITTSGVVDEWHDVEHVLFVRNVSGSGRRAAEVILLAKGVRRLAPEERESIGEITYAGVPLNRIFHGNVWKADEDNYANVTFAADEVKYPASDDGLFIALDEEYADAPQAVRLNSTRGVLFNQGMRGYYSEEIDKVEYDQLQALILDESRWKNNSAARQLVTDESSVGSSPSFLEVIRKEDDELVFSNLLAYYFDYSHIAFKAFAEMYLNIQDMGTSFSVMREHEHIDIYIRWNDGRERAIVIENKIGSGINGIRDGKTQLDDYRAKAKEETGTEPDCYIFAPDYNTRELIPYAKESGYAIVPYSAILDFFVKNSAAFIADRCFPDFLRGLKRHSVSSVAEHNYETMRQRFLNRIRQSIS